MIASPGAAATRAQGSNPETWIEAMPKAVQALPQSVPVTPELRRWRGLVIQSKRISAKPSVKDSDLDAAQLALLEASRDAWSRPPRTLNDIVLLAEIARFWCWPDEDPHAREDYQEILAGSGYSEERAVAHLLHSLGCIAQ